MLAATAPFMLPVPGESFVRPFKAGYGLRLTGATSGYVGLKPAAAAGATDFVLPTGDAVGGGCWVSDGSGNLSVETTAQTYTRLGITATVPAGVGTELQYRNGSSFGAITGSSYSTGVVTLPTLAVTDLTAGRIPYVGTAGRLADSANFAWNNTNKELLLGGSAYIAHTSSTSVSWYTQWADSNTPEIYFSNVAYPFQFRGRRFLFVSTGDASTSVATVGVNLASGQVNNAFEVTSFGGTAGDLFNVAYNGRVGIGGTPTTKLTVIGSHVGGIGLASISSVTAGTDAWMTFDSATVKDAGFFFKENGTTKWYLYNAGSDSNKFKLTDAIGVDVISVTSAGATTLTTGTASSVVLTVKGTTSQSGNLQNWTSVAGSALFSITSGGLCKNEGAFGLHDFSAFGTGEQILKVGNKTAGTGNYGGFRIVNDNTNLITCLAMSSMFTTSGGYVQGSGVIDCQGVGGLTIAADHASGVIRFYAGGIGTSDEKMRLTTNGLGVGTNSPSARIHAIATTEQLRLGYDVSKYMSTTVDNVGRVTFNAVGITPDFLFNQAITGNANISAGTYVSAQYLKSQSGGIAKVIIYNVLANEWDIQESADGHLAFVNVTLGSQPLTIDGTTGGFTNLGTAGSAVHTYKTTTTNDDPTVNIYQNRVATTDATVTTLHTVAIADNTTYALSATVECRCTGGAGGNSGKAARFDFITRVRRSGGIALLGTVTSIYSDQDGTAWAATFDVDGGNNAYIRVTGAATDDITWHVVELKVSPLSS